MDDFSHLDGIFDDLTPDQLTGVSAVSTKPGTFVGQEAFDKFVRKSLASTRKHYLKRLTDIDPLTQVAVYSALATPATRLVYEPEQEDTLRAFLDRIKQDAAVTQATWFFFALKTVVGVFQAPADSEGPDIASDAALSEAIGNGVTGEGILWHAERREGGKIERRCGVLTIVDRRIVDETEGLGDQANEKFSNILP